MNWVTANTFKSHSCMFLCVIHSHRDTPATTCQAPYRQYNHDGPWVELHWLSPVSNTPVSNTGLLSITPVLGHLGYLPFDWYWYWSNSTILRTYSCCVQKKSCIQHPPVGYRTFAQYPFGKPLMPMVCHSLHSIPLTLSLQSTITTTNR